MFPLNEVAASCAAKAAILTEKVASAALQKTAAADYRMKTCITGVLDR
jgi:hypothetical protein